MNVDQEERDDGSTRRGFLSGVAGGGLAGLLLTAAKAEGATGAQSVSASLGQVASGVYQWADPAGYAGANAARSNVTPETGAVYVGWDSGSETIYRGDGSAWVEVADLSAIGSGGGSGTIDVENVNGTTLAAVSAMQAGTDLAWTDDGDGSATLDYTGSGGSGGTYATPAGTTVTDIANAVANNRAVRLEPGTVYSNDGTETITHDGTSNDADTVVIAHGATVQVRSNPTVEVLEGSISGGGFQWYGGVLEGSQSAGEVAFQATDAIRNRFDPKAVFDCEAAFVFRNDDLWCEYNTIDAWTGGNETSLMLLGGQTSPPTGSNVVAPSGSGGTVSFRRFDIDLRPEPRSASDGLTAQSTAYGIYMADAKPYASNWQTTVSGDSNCVGWRIDGNLNGSWFQYHYETPGSKSGGTAIQVDGMQRGPSFMSARVSGSADNEVVNNTSNPLFYHDCARTDGGSIVGWEVKMDGSTVQRWVDGLGGSPTQEFETGYKVRYKESGSSTSPTIRIGSNGAGLYVNGSGELVAVDEAGNDTVLT